MAREGYQLLDRALQKLSEKFRRVITYRQIMRMSAAETAEVMEMQPNAVNVLFHRAQRKLHSVFMGQHRWLFRPGYSVLFCINENALSQLERTVGRHPLAGF